MMAKYEEKHLEFQMVAWKGYKSFTGCPDGDSWCWHDKLWTLDGEERSIVSWDTLLRPKSLFQV
jgi:hypothetical protein